MKKRSKFAPIFVALILFLMYLPILVVIVYSFNESKYSNWTGFTFDWYDKLFSNKAIGASVINSLKVGVSSCLLSIVIGTAGAIGMNKSKFKFKSMLENLSLVPIMIPEIILGMAYLAFFTFLDIELGFTTLIISHTMFCIPYVFINVQSRLVGIDPHFVEAARDMGASPVRAFFDITLPLISPAIISGALLAFAMSIDDVVISYFVTGATTNTLPLKVFSMLKTGVTPEINALCTVMLVIVWTAIGLGLALKRVRNLQSK